MDKHHDPLAIENWRVVPNFNHCENRHVKLAKFNHFKRRLAKMLAKANLKNEVSR